MKTFDCPRAINDVITKWKIFEQVHEERRKKKRKKEEYVNDKSDRRREEILNIKSYNIIVK